MLNYLFFFYIEGNILTSDKLQSLRDEIDKIQYLKNQMNEWTANAKDISMQAETNITNIKYIIDNTTNILRRTSDFIQTDGATTLEKARKKSDEIGQQSKQMTDIAREARQYVDEYVLCLYKYTQHNSLLISHVQLCM